MGRAASGAGDRRVCPLLSFAFVLRRQGRKTKAKDRRFLSLHLSPVHPSVPPRQRRGGHYPVRRKVSVNGSSPARASWCKRNQPAPRSRQLSIECTHGTQRPLVAPVGSSRGPSQALLPCQSVRALPFLLRAPLRTECFASRQRETYRPTAAQPCKLQRRQRFPWHPNAVQLQSRLLMSTESPTLLFRCHTRKTLDQQDDHGRKKSRSPAARLHASFVARRHTGHFELRIYALPPRSGTKPCSCLRLLQHSR